LKTRTLYNFLYLHRTWRAEYFH